MADGGHKLNIEKKKTKEIQKCLYISKHNLILPGVYFLFTLIGGILFLSKIFSVHRTFMSMRCDSWENLLY